MFLKQVCDSSAGRIVRVRIVVLMEQLTVLGIGQNIQQSQRLIRIRQDAVCQYLKMCCNFLNPIFLENICVIFNIKPESLLRFHKIEGHIQFAGPQFPVKLGDLQPFQRELHSLGVLQNQHHIKKRGPAEIMAQPQFVHQPVKRIDLMIKRLCRGLSDLPEKRDKALLPLYPVPQGQGVQIVSDLIFQVSMKSPRGRASDNDIVLSGIAEEQYFHGCHKRHKKTHALFPGKFTEAPGPVRGKREKKCFPVECLYRRTGIIPREVQHRYLTRKLLMPILTMGSDFITFQKMPLPDRIVPILYAERPERAFPAFRKRVIHLAEFPDHHAHRPSVGDDVAHVHQHDMP